jgi:enoyl-CoA hydratase/carnithine racemase
MPVVDALVMESATYSTLQAGPEHQRWLASRPTRTRPRDESEGRVEVRRAGDRVEIELARPAARNAVDAAMQQALVDAFFVAGDAAEIVVTGQGPVFSAGGDLDEFGTLTDPASAHVLRVRRSPARALSRVADRTTFVVQGACHGAGVELAAFAARVIARPDATFTLPEVGMGLVPGAGGTVSIPRRIGRQRTAWLALTGSPLDLPTAVSWGLVDGVID